MNQIRNGIFDALEEDDYQHLKKTVSRPIQLRTEMDVVSPRGKHVTIPKAQMLVVVSHYQTVLGVVGALVPIERVNEKTGEKWWGRRLYRWADMPITKNGETVIKPIPKTHPTHLRRVEVVMDYDHLGRVLASSQQQLRRVIKSPTLPGGLLEMAAGFRIIECFTRPRKKNFRQRVQQWNIFKIDEGCIFSRQKKLQDQLRTAEAHGDSKKIGQIKQKLEQPDPINVTEALELEMELQCPPVFEMLPKGFVPTLMKDLAKFLGREEPFLAETTTAHRYKAYMASEDAAQFHQMFLLEEQMRKELGEAYVDTREALEEEVLEEFRQYSTQVEYKRRERIIHAGENISAAPVREVLEKDGAPHESKRDKARKADRKRIGAKTGGFGLQEGPVAWEKGNKPKVEDLVSKPSKKAVATAEESKVGGFGMSAFPAESQEPELQGGLLDLLDDDGDW